MGYLAAGMHTGIRAARADDLGRLTDEEAKDAFKFALHRTQARLPGPTCEPTPVVGQREFDAHGAQTAQ